MHPEYITLPKKSIDITGQRFGRLVALGPVGRGRRYTVKWLCQCDCGNFVTITNEGLSTAHTESCGCLRREAATHANTTHGMSRTPAYNVWRSMVQRCHNPDCRTYPNYGGRGITVCDQWLHDFQSFYNHVCTLPHYGEKGYTLDRILNDGPYAPDNVQWATPAQQNRNYRRNRMISYGGETLCLSDWATRMGMLSHTLDYRLTHGWSIEDALTTPVKRPKR